MMLNVTKVDVWAATLEDKPGTLAGKLEGLARAGANLEFIIARRAADKPGQGVVFVTPLRGEAQLKAAAALGFACTDRLHSVRIEGPDEPGAGFLITQSLAAEGINLRGLSGATMAGRLVFFLAFDSLIDAQKAMKRLERPI